MLTSLSSAATNKENSTDSLPVRRAPPLKGPGVFFRIRAVGIDGLMRRLGDLRHQRPVRVDVGHVIGRIVSEHRDALDHMLVIRYSRALQTLRNFLNRVQGKPTTHRAT